MEITTWTKVENLNDRDARLWVYVAVDGTEVHNFILLSGPQYDVLDYVDGIATLDDIRARWAPRQRSQGTA